MDPPKELAKGLPPDLKQEIEDFARFLLERRARKSEGKADVTMLTRARRLESTT
jgi:hypothetical protein